MGYSRRPRNTNIDRWQRHRIDTPHGELRLTVFPDAPEPFYGACWLNDRPIPPARAHDILVEIDHELAAMRWLGRDPVPPDDRSAYWRTPGE